MEFAQPPHGLSVRNMTRQEVIDIAVPWAGEQGWNPGQNDGGIFFDTDPDGFFLAELDGEALGCLSAVNYSEAFSFLGFFLVQEERRGQGIGYALSQAALAHAGNRLMGLDGVVAQQDNYRYAGFEMAFKSVRYRGQGGGQGPDDLLDAQDMDFDELAAYDSQHFPAPRPGFLKAWISQPGGAALCMTLGGSLDGFGVLRPCLEGHKIGPLFAGDQESALRIYQGLAARAGKGPVFLDVPQNNSAAVAMARDLGMEPVFETARMYKNGAPQWPTERIFGITSFELG